MSEDTDAPRRPKRKVLYTVKQFVDADTLRADLSYSTADLTGAMVTQASLLVHYGVLLAKASRQVDELKMLLETAEAKVYRKLRDAAVKAAKEGGDKPTEAMLAKQVAADDYIISVNIALNEARQVEAIAKTAVEGFRHRKDMLIQLGLMAREEIKGEVSISRRQEADRLRDGQMERIKEALAAKKSEE